MMAVDSTSISVILVLALLSPAFVFFSAISLFFVRPSADSISPSSITQVVVTTRIPRRALILSCLSLSALTYLLDGLTYVVYAVIEKSWHSRNGIEFSPVIGLVAYSGLAALGAWKDVQGVEVWLFKRVKASIAISLILDIAQVFLIGQSMQSLPVVDHPSVPIPTLLHFALPSARVLILIPLLAALRSPHVLYTSVQSDEAVEAPEPTSSTLLLPSDRIQASTGLSPVSGSATEATKYGTFHPRPTFPPSQTTTGTVTPEPSGDDQKDEENEANPEVSWSQIGNRLRRISPRLWPSNDRRLQFLAVICILLLLVGRFVNAVVPFTLGEVVKIFGEGTGRSPWPYLFAYVGLRYLQSSGGLGAIRDSLWTPVMQYSDREMAQLAFEHILNLSFAFHTHRKTGEILRILDRGAAINHTLEFVAFSIIPTFIDIAVALVIFCFKFGWLLSLVIFIVMSAYVFASIVLTRYRTKIRRQMIDRDVTTRGIHTDCLLNYETVKYFGGEEYEANRYRQAIREYQGFEYKVTLSINLLNAVQNFIISTGLLVGSLIVAHRITKGESQASDFVIFITYLAQLYGPLNSLGYVYRAINQALIDTEKLLKLLDEPSEIDDRPDAPDMVVDQGEIEFQNVKFSYDGRKTALNGISFKVPKGSSVALVGESGAGKSTVLRLLYRFYDLASGDGKILIDGQDITEVTQASLRKAIGVVPQDSVLFNGSISYNIGYGKFGASLEEIEHAAKAAQMHDRIMSFPSGYETKVGERGVRLSGGEKQRVAIARTLLKNPPILLLDEATSALDTSTEKDIQKALQNLVKGRSSLSIAHRLSTIASADVILVLKDGQIVEQGSHKELLALGGVFASMWADQISSSDDFAISTGGDSPKKEPSGYAVEQSDAAPLVQIDGPEEPASAILEGGFVNTPETVQEVLPPEDSPVGVVGDTAKSPSDALAKAVETQAKAESPQSATPFPTADAAAPSQSQSPGVTFESDVGSPPRTGGTPDPESEPKRKRISSQNFQRLARKMSLNTRRSGSTSSIPIISGLLRDNSPRGSTDGGSAREGEGIKTDSPSSSVQGDTDKGGKKKKEKKRKSIL